MKKTFSQDDVELIGKSPVCSDCKAFMIPVEGTEFLCLCAKCGKEGKLIFFN